MVPAEGGPNIFEAYILLAPKAPKQSFGCQPQTLEGEEGGGVQGGGGGVRRGTAEHSATTHGVGKRLSTDCPRQRLRLVVGGG